MLCSWAYCKCQCRKLSTWKYHLYQRINRVSDKNKMVDLFSVQSLSSSFKYLKILLRCLSETLQDIIRDLTVYTWIETLLWNYSSSSEISLNILVYSFTSTFTVARFLTWYGVFLANTAFFYTNNILDIAICNIWLFLKLTKLIIYPQLVQLWSNKKRLETRKLTK